MPPLEERRNSNDLAHVTLHVSDEEQRQQATGAEEPPPPPPHGPSSSSKQESVRALLMQRAEQAEGMNYDAEFAERETTRQLAPHVPSTQRPRSPLGDRSGFMPLPQTTHAPTQMDMETSDAAASAVTAATAPAARPPLTLSNAISRVIPPRVLGFTYLALSAVVFSVMSLLVSVLSDELPSFQIVLARCIIQAGCGIASCRYLGVDIIGPVEKRKWLLIRGSLGFISFSCYYYSMSHLTLADATTIFFTAPLYTGLLGFLFLGERVGRVDIGLTLLSVTGVVMVVRPAAIFGNTGGGDEADSASDSTAGLIAAIAGSFVSAFVYIAIRKVGPGVHPLVLVSYMGMVGSVLAPLGAIVQTFVAPSANGWVLLIAVGATSFIGQICFNAGVQREAAGPASMIRNLDVALSFLWQLGVQGITPNVWSVLGAMVITGAVITMGLRKWRADASKTRVDTAVPAANLLVQEEGEPRDDEIGQVELTRKLSLELDHGDAPIHETSARRPGPWHT